MSGEPEDCDCGPEEPPDPEPGCGPQGCQSPNVYKYLLTQPDGPGTCVVCGTTPQCVPPDTENAFDTLELCCDTANDSNEQIDPPCPRCVVEDTCPPGYISCGATGGVFIIDSDIEWSWVSDDGCPEGCVAFKAEQPTAEEEAAGLVVGDLSYDGICCEPEPGLGGLAVPSNRSVEGMNHPCSQKECEAHVSTWIGYPVGEEVVDGLYRLEWDLIDDCPGACCTEAPKEPELGNTTIFVNTPCKCNCQEG